MIRKRKITMDLGKVRLVAEITEQNAPVLLPEINVYLEDKATGAYQDLCSVCPDMDEDDFAEGKTPRHMDVLVWGREYDECYTESFTIPVLTESEDDDEDEDEPYTPSSACGDYGPGNPWDAPGMSIHDFI